MTWSEAELGELQERVRSWLEGFGYGVVQRETRRKPWLLEARVSGLHIGIAPHPKRRLLQVTNTIRVDENKRRRLRDLPETERRVVVQRLRLLFLDRGLDVNFQDEDGTLQRVILRRHLTPDDLTSQSFLDTLKTLRDGFRKLLVGLRLGLDEGFPGGGWVDLNLEAASAMDPNGDALELVQEHYVPVGDSLWSVMEERRRPEESMTDLLERLVREQDASPGGGARQGQSTG